MQEFLNPHPLSGVPGTALDPSRIDLSAAFEWMEDYALATKYLEGIGPADDEEARNLKLDYLELEKRVRRRKGLDLPDWWYTLKGKVEEGAI